MTVTLRQWAWLVLSTVLTACAAAQPGAAEEAGEQEEIASLEDWCAEEGSLIALCRAERCGLYRCREVVEELRPGRVRLAQMIEGEVLPGPGSSVQRYWGSAEALPETVQPVLLIPWNAQPPQLLPSQMKLLEEQEAERRKPHEKHHIFPQEPGLKAWFGEKGINIHEYTMPLPIEVHRRIHHPPPPGGDWNEAWRRYRDAHFGAPREELMRYAGQLIYEFELAGPVVPYYRQWTQPPPVRGG
jgi:uncharacterized lipoprotein (TIGR02269 family)